MSSTLSTPGVQMNHQKTRAVALTAMFALIAGLVLVFSVITGTAAAHADNCTTSNGTTTCTSSAISSSTSSTTSKAAADSTSNGRVILRYESANGFQTNASCGLVRYRPATPPKSNQPKCVAFPAGTMIYNSGIHANGTRYKFSYSVKSTDRFYWDSQHRVWRKQNCGNYVWFTATPGPFVSNPIVVRTFSSFTATATATAKSVATAKSTAQCQVNGASASAYAEASAEGTATATATAKGSSAAQAQQNAIAGANVAQVQEDSRGRALASAESASRAHAESQANCTSTTASPAPSPSASTSSPTPTPSQSTPATTCYSAYGPGYSGTYPNCTKDGTTQPPPPSQAPGPNPSPSNTTSSQCYDPNTGQPVAPGTPGARCQ